MLNAFNNGLAERLRTLPLSSEVQAQLVRQSGDLVNLEMPDGVSDEAQVVVARAVRESFVAGFRVVAYLAAGLAAASAVASWLLIAGRTPREAGKAAGERVAPRQTESAGS